MKKYRISHNVDMQGDFVLPNGVMYVAGADRLIAPVNQFLAQAKFDMNIVTMDTHDSKTYAKSAEAEMFPIHCQEGTPGWELTVQYQQPYTTIKKHVFDVWQNNAGDMDKALHGFHSKNTDVYLFGVASDFCVRDAIIGYLQRGYDVHVIENLCRGINKQIPEVITEDCFAKYRKNNQLRLNAWQQILTRTK